MLSKNRPINLDLTTICFPPMAIISILHRISGIFLFLLMPIMLCLLSSSLMSPASFATIKAQFTHPLYFMTVWVFSSSLAFHVIAGIRHLCMDLGWGEHLNVSRITALLAMALALIAIIILGIWIW